jgi:hypothetical protein
MINVRALPELAYVGNAIAVLITGKRQPLNVIKLALCSRARVMDGRRHSVIADERR